MSGQTYARAIFPAPFTKSAAAAVWKVSVTDARYLLEHLSRLALADHYATSALYEVHQRVERVRLWLAQLHESP